MYKYLYIYAYLSGSINKFGKKEKGLTRTNSDFPKSANYFN